MDDSDMAVIESQLRSVKERHELIPTIMIAGSRTMLISGENVLVYDERLFFNEPKKYSLSQLSSHRLFRQRLSEFNSKIQVGVFSEGEAQRDFEKSMQSVSPIEKTLSIAARKAILAPYYLWYGTTLERCFEFEMANQRKAATAALKVREFINDGHLLFKKCQEAYGASGAVFETLESCMAETDTISRPYRTIADTNNRKADIIERYLDIYFPKK